MDMEDRDLHPIITSHFQEPSDPEIIRTKRNEPPVHYTLMINSFSELSEAVKFSTEDRYESVEFVVGGCTWKLILYPNGDARRNGAGHISLYLAMADASLIPLGIHVGVMVKFFIYDHIREQYLSVQDGRVTRYHAFKTEHGVARLMPLTTFTSLLNGYLVNDCCVFGVEIHVIKSTCNVEKFSILKNPSNNARRWKIHNFSKLDKHCYFSEAFVVGNCKWKLLMHPKGDLRANERSLSLFLWLEGHVIQPSRRVLAEFKLSIQDQVRRNHSVRTGKCWFYSPGNGKGFPDFVSLSQIHDSSTGLLVNDTLVIEGEITQISVTEIISTE